MRNENREKSRLSSQNVQTDDEFAGRLYMQDRRVDPERIEAHISMADSIEWKFWDENMEQEEPVAEAMASQGAI